MGILRGAAQKLTESDDHAHGGVVSMIAHQAGDGIESVVHEVRLHLPAQGGELRFREILIQTSSLGNLAGHALPSVRDVRNGYDQSVSDQKGEGLVDER